MSLWIYNTLKRKKEPFKELKKGEVGLYVCGPTVYDLLHIGNFRGAIFFNLVCNWLEKKGYKVRYVYNYTDVDDKIIERAKKEGEEALKVSQKYIKEFEKDYKSLGLRKHTHNPKATEYVEKMVDFIGKLEKKNLAYVTETGIYYHVDGFKGYGKLSGKKLEDLKKGVRIELDESKRKPYDFALWKFSNEKPHWPSPWGKGRPGWHLECSVMSTDLLGESIDIHGGGLDLIFPHHENEICQSEGVFSKPFSSYWMHHNMIQFQSEKMSKSLGNVKTARSFIEEYDAEILKAIMMRSHYRSVVDFNEEQIEKTIKTLSQFYSALSLSERIKGGEKSPLPSSFENLLKDVEKKIDEALDDDFNTPLVFSHLFEVLKSFNGLCRKPPITDEKKAVSEAFFRFLKEKGQLMSLFGEPSSLYLENLEMRLLKKKGLKKEDIEEKILLRKKARKEKDFGRADALRKELFQMGILIQDDEKGDTRWEVDKS